MQTSETRIVCTIIPFQRVTVKHEKYDNHCDGRNSRLHLSVGSYFFISVRWHPRKCKNSLPLPQHTNIRIFSARRHDGGQLKGKPLFFSIYVHFHHFPKDGKGVKDVTSVLVHRKVQRSNAIVSDKNVSQYPFREPWSALFFLLLHILLPSLHFFPRFDWGKK